MEKSTKEATKQPIKLVKADESKNMEKPKSPVPPPPYEGNFLIDSKAVTDLMNHLVKLPYEYSHGIIEFLKQNLKIEQKEEKNEAVN